jgi:hypothetical protein
MVQFCETQSVTVPWNASLVQIQVALVGAQSSFWKALRMHDDYRDPSVIGLYHDREPQ